jgi:hypothetical protein
MLLKSNLCNTPGEGSGQLSGLGSSPEKYGHRFDDAGGFGRLTMVICLKTVTHDVVVRLK